MVYRTTWTQIRLVSGKNLKTDEEYKVFAVAAVEYFQKTYKDELFHGEEVTVGRDVNTVIDVVRYQILIMYHLNEAIKSIPSRTS